MYVIESAVHGVFTGIDWSRSGNSYGPRFGWAMPRHEGQVFYSLAEAKKKLTEIRTFKHYT